MDMQLGDEERGPFVRFQSSSELSGGGDEPASFRFPLSERSQDGTEGDTELSMPLLEWDPLFTMKQFKWEPGSPGTSSYHTACQETAVFCTLTSLSEIRRVWPGVFFLPMSTCQDAMGGQFALFSHPRLEWGNGVISAGC